MSDVVEPAAVAQSTKPRGVPAIVLGSIGFVLAFIPFLNFATGVLPLIGLILGIIALVSKTNPKKTVALVGVIISAVAAVVTIIMITVYTAVFFVAVGSAVKDSTTPVTVVYSVTGTATAGNVTYSTYTNGQSGTEQATDQTLPFTKTITGTKGFSSYSLTASNSNSDTDISCAITVDGKQVSTQTSHGAFATVSCSSTGTSD